MRISKKDCPNRYKDTVEPLRVSLPKECLADPAPTVPRGCKVLRWWFMP